MVVHQSTVLLPTFSYIFFLHAGDKSHHEACLHLPQFLYFAAFLSCFAAPHIIFPLERVWQFVRSLLSPLRLVLCVVMGGTVCTVGRHVYVCVHVHSIQVLGQYIHIHLYVQYIPMQYVHTYVRYTSQVTFTNPTHFEEFRCEFR